MKKHNFDKDGKKAAKNIYKAMKENYTPVPRFLIENKKDIIDFLESAWVAGANWRYTELVYGDLDYIIDGVLKQNIHIKELNKTYRTLKKLTKKVK